MPAEPSAHLDHLARTVIGAALEVHRVLGPGYLESCYEAALAVELSRRGVPAGRQVPVAVQYKGIDVGSACLDLLVDGVLVVELKAVQTLLPVHRAQVISYLKAIRRPLGLLINFNVPLLRQGLKRVVLS